MKKFFTLIAAALAAVSVNAQEVETLALSIDAYPWNYTAAMSSAAITFNSQWGEFALIGSGNSVDLTDIKGYKIEYTAYPETASEADGYVQTSIGDKQYNDFATDATVMEQDFNDDVKALGTLSKFNIQAKTSTAQIDINSFVLVKTDGTEVPVTAFDGSGWGRNIGPAASVNLTFTGQYGGLAIVQKDGTKCGFVHADEGDNAYTYNIALGNTTENTIMIEFDNTSNSGFAWNKLDAGLNNISFVLSKETAAKNEYDDNDQLISSTPTDVGAIYLKANADAGYPFAVNVTSITRVKSTLDGITNTNAAEQLNDYVNAPIFNLAGQQVSKSYKGVVIQNGKKFIQK